MPKVKKKKEVLQVIPRESRDTKDYNEALRDGSWPKERENEQRQSWILIRVRDSSSS